MSGNPMIALEASLRERRLEQIKARRQAVKDVRTMIFGGQPFSGPGSDDIDWLLAEVERLTLQQSEPES